MDLVEHVEMWSLRMLVDIPIWGGTGVLAFWAFRVGLGYPIDHILHLNVISTYLFFLIFYLALIMPAFENF